MLKLLHFPQILVTFCYKSHSLIFHTAKTSFQMPWANDILPLPAPVFLLSLLNFYSNQHYLKTEH